MFGLFNKNKLLPAKDSLQQNKIKELELQIELLESEHSDFKNIFYSIKKYSDIFYNFYISRIVPVHIENLENELKKRPENKKIKEEIESFKSEVDKQEVVIKHKQINQQNLREIKAIFKEIAKIIHPDIVKKEFSNISNSVFNEAQNAKNLGDLEKLKELLEILKNGNKPDVKTENIENIYTRKIEKITQEIKNLKEEINLLKLKDENFQQILELFDVENISDLEVIFKQDEIKFYKQIEKYFDEWKNEI
jgi:hypothetical protein